MGANMEIEEPTVIKSDKKEKRSGGTLTSLLSYDFSNLSAIDPKD